MSETIILIMTSSSTRNTEPRGGRVAVMRYQSLPNRRVRFAKFPLGCNVFMFSPPSDRYLTGLKAELLLRASTPGHHGRFQCRNVGDAKMFLNRHRISHQMLGDRRFAEPARRG